MLRILSISFFMMLLPPISMQSFKDQQLKYSRVSAARDQKEAIIKALLQRKGLDYPPRRIFLRVFKSEQILELWAAPAEGKHQLLKEYKICASSGSLGPKRREGDRQVPEGFYFIDVFNPVSNYHLSMRVNYPNESDRILGAKGRLGGDIYIHGDCVTIGCVPLTDEKIKELYWIAVEAKSSGQKNIPVHIFPAKLTDEGFRNLRKEFPDRSEKWDFWRNLKEGYDYFEKRRRLPSVKVNKFGKYVFSAD